MVQKLYPSRPALDVHMSVKGRERANSLNPMRCARRARGEQLEDDQFEDQVGPLFL